MPAAPPNVLTVTELTRRIKTLLEGQFVFVWVEGEVSNYSAATSGHRYFTLKDANAQLACVLFRQAGRRIPLELHDGLHVLAAGNLSVYERRGQYQLIVTEILPKGLGALQLAFEQLKKKLAAEGLFDPARKKPLPVLPRRIGVVTSPQGAAIRDFLNILGRRFPNLPVLIHPVRVQGAGAAEEIAAAIDELNARQLVDVIVVTRGGGSLEDLWAFNEEVVARALARSRLPTISAVGHEIDFTIADFVADLRAPTPSAAAELVVQSRDDFLRRLRQHQQRLDQELRYRLAQWRRRLADCRLRHPAELIRQHQQRLDDLAHRLRQAAGGVLARARHRCVALADQLQLLSPQAVIRDRRQRLAACRDRLLAHWGRHRQHAGHRLAAAAGKLEVLSPRATLARGYSITRTADGLLIRSVRAVQPGQRVRTMVSDGEFDSTVG